VRWCLALFDGLIAGGLTHLVISPGSRSTPVILAAQRRPAIVIEPILDERSAAFYALGLARALDRPVALLATSGSAPAHWLPAVMEASESAVPLILLSADRPPELRGWGANQTVDQTRLFGPFVREFHDPGPPLDSPRLLKAMTALGLRAAQVSLGLRAGPVHLNLPFREPLVPRPNCRPEPGAPTLDPHSTLDGQRSGIAAPACPPPPPPEIAGGLRGRGVIYCGPDRPRPGFAESLWRCAAALGVPVLADPLSGLRFGPVPGRAVRIGRYKTMVRNLRAARALRPDWVLRFGRAPISKTVLDWLTGTRTVLVDPAERWADPTHDLAQPGSVHLAVDPRSLCDSLAAAPPEPPVPNWLGIWTKAERRVARLARDFLEVSPWCEAHSLVELLDVLPPGEGLLCANSLPIRQLETWAGTRTEPLRLFGNRGVSGIDGQVSTLAGLNAGGLPTTGLLGDLSLLHDLSGLLLARRLDRPLIVLNNGGGRIFDYLPQAGLPDFERLWRLAPQLEIGELARPFRLQHLRVCDPEGWRAALSESLGAEPGTADPLLIEVMVNAQLSRDVHINFRRLIAEQDLID
jgi:2-succinyl-5-enolpyruvyl-6-hydroxy-3-cyclohexene-1-carboxylate synthase